MSDAARAKEQMIKQVLYVHGADIPGEDRGSVGFGARFGARLRIQREFSKNAGAASSEVRKVASRTAQYHATT